MAPSQQVAKSASKKWKELETLLDKVSPARWKQNHGDSNGGSSLFHARLCANLKHRRNLPLFAKEVVELQFMDIADLILAFS